MVYPAILETKPRTTLLLVEVLEDEFYIEFKVQDKTNINPVKTYELVVLMYQPSLLRVNATTKDVSINF